MVKDYKDFALSDYARVGRALALYEVGDKDEAIAEMEDVSISLKGYPGTFSFFSLFCLVYLYRIRLCQTRKLILCLVIENYTLFKCKELFMQTRC